MPTEVTTIKVTKKQRELIGDAAKKHKKKIGEFVYQCALFVHKRRLDPYDLKETEVIEEFKKLKSQLISFIRKQERDHIVPLHNSVNDMTRQLVSTTDTLEGIYANSANFEDDLPGEQPKQTLTADLDDSNIKLLREELDKKNRLINQVYKDIQTLKNAAKSQRGKVLIELSADEFNRIVSLGSLYS